MAEDSNPWLPSFGRDKPATKKKAPRYFDASESAPADSAATEQKMERTKGPDGSRAGKDYSSQSSRGRGYDSRQESGRTFNPSAAHRGRGQVSHRGHTPNSTRNSFPHGNSWRGTRGGRGGDQRRDFQTDFDFQTVYEAGSTENWKGELVIAPNLSVPKEPKMRAKKYDGPAPVELERLKRHSRGVGVNTQCVMTKFHKTVVAQREKLIEDSIEQAARAEVLLTENEGHLEVDEGDYTIRVTQKEIAAAVDITTATKHFDLHLDTFGPYRIDYNRSGRFLLVGGRKGHVAAMDWQSKKLLCEMNVMEEVFDVQWLHVETMFAVAQKNSVFIYDNQATELHCLKSLSRILRMEFLPYHFLLVCSSETGKLNWMDVSIGKEVASFFTRCGRLNVMTQNPANAVICIGQSRGIVSMWSPKSKEPLVKFVAHPHPIQAMAIDHTGTYMATSCLNRTVRIWDLRNLGQHVGQYHLRSNATNISISQRGLMAVSMGNIVEVFRDCLKGGGDCTGQAYLKHKFRRPVENMQFCPFEDVLGAGHYAGFTSLIVPGAGEANFDGLETNPYQSKAYRQEAEVKRLLGKIQPDFISLDPQNIGVVNIEAAETALEKKQAAAMTFKRPTLGMKHRKNVKGGATMINKVQKKVDEAARMKFLKNKAGMDAEMMPADQLEPSAEESVLDRFRPKKNTNVKPAVKKQVIARGRVSKAKQSKHIFVG